MYKKRGIKLTPKDKIQSLIQEAKDLRSQAEQAIASFNSPYTPILGELALKAFIPHGYKGTARNIGSKAFKGNKDAVNKRWRQQGAQLSKGCISDIRKMSINTKNLTFSGNSQRLVNKFNRLKKIKNALPFFNNLIAILEEIEDMDLLWNKDITEELKKRQKIKEEERQQKAILRAEAQEIVKSARQIELYKRSEIIKKLSNFPRVQNSLSAAFDRLQDTSPDASRHCIVSCRVGLEQFCMDAGESNDWKQGLNNIHTSDTDRKQIKQVRHFLSGKGAHGGHDPNKTEAEYCLKITIASLESMLKKVKR